MFTRKVRDNLHGTIPFSEVERVVIDSPEFQRLRRVGQTSFVRYVFPGAVHTRFEHSLGTMHLAEMMLTRIVRSQRRILEDFKNALENVSPTLANDARAADMRGFSLLGTESALNTLETCDYVRACVRMAALVHDLGHPPFSHSCEKFLPSWQTLENQLPELHLPQFLGDYFQAKIATLRATQAFDMNETRLRHEDLTLMLTAQVFTREPEISFEMAHDVCAILDTSLPVPRESRIARAGLRWLLHEIVSGEIDADRMDYLRRDARACGVVYGLFDIERIVDSLGFYADEHGNCHLALKRSGVPAFEDYLRARLSTYEQVYFHKTSTGCEAMLDFAHRHLDGFALPMDLDSFADVDDTNLIEYARRFALSPEAIFAHNVMRDMIRNRCLWKGVYEEQVPRARLATTPSLCPAVLSFLREKGVPCEMIENRPTLTRLMPRGRKAHSDNALRVIVRDVHGLRRLEPIESYSMLVNRMDEEQIIRRVFVGRQTSTGQVIDIKALRTEISRRVVAPEVL